MDAPRPSYHPSPSRPRLELPPGACDAHCHIFGPEAIFPFAEGRSFTPAEAPKERLFALHSLLGITRCAIVQSGCHGFDNRVVADAIAAKRGAYCGVALVPLTVTDDELESLDARGFRGARFNYMKHLGTQAPIDEVIAFTARLAGIGWHLQVHFDAALIDQLAPSLVRSSVPVVIDHMARIDASRGREQPAFGTLLELMAHDFVWVKVSGVDRCSRQGPPYADAVALARELVQSFGDRVLWGTDWPHPNHTHVPDDGLLVDLIAKVAPSPALRQALLVDNPQRLYRFADTVAGEP